MLSALLLLCALAPSAALGAPEGATSRRGAGDAVAVFDREPVIGALSQPGGTAGCIATANSGCATGLALGAPEGMAISPDGRFVYATANKSDAVDVFRRVGG